MTSSRYCDQLKIILEQSFPHVLKDGWMDGGGWRIVDGSRAVCE